MVRSNASLSWGSSGSGSRSCTTGHAADERGFTKLGSGSVERGSASLYQGSSSSGWGSSCRGRVRRCMDQRTGYWLSSSSLTLRY